MCQGVYIAKLFKLLDYLYLH